MINREMREAAGLAELPDLPDLEQVNGVIAKALTAALELVRRADARPTGGVRISVVDGPELYRRMIRVVVECEVRSP